MIQREVPKANLSNARDNRRLLVNQVAGSPYLSKSSRLRDMFIYVCGRVLDESADEIHEQEVGREVFGRPADYDTTADNTVRVHASKLRQRVNQYFENEGSSEPLIIEIPRGNYAPVFRERPVRVVEEVPQADAAPQPGTAIVAERAFPVWVPTALSVFFALTTLGLLGFVTMRPKPSAETKLTPAVREIWEQVFPKGRATDLVLGDAALAIVEERTDRPVSLTEYFDRSYLAGTDARSAEAKLDPAFTKALLLKRQVNYGDVALLARMTDMARAVDGDTKLHFARDYTFRDLKADNSVLFGNALSNPWVEPFASRLTVRWKFDADKGIYYPVDSSSKPEEQEKYHASAAPDGSHEGYASVALLSNLSGTGNVLIISATGGSAMNAAMDFLCDESAMKQVRTQLAPGTKLDAAMPNFEVLIRASSRSNLPRNTSVLVVRKIS